MGDIVMWIGFFDEKDNTAAINIKALFAYIKNFEKQILGREHSKDRFSNCQS